MLNKLNNFFLKLNFLLYPEEIFVGVFFLGFYAFFYIQNWQIIFYERSISFFLYLCIIYPCLFFFIINFFHCAFIEKKINNFLKKSIILCIDALRIWGLFFIVLIIHGNIKINVPLINNNLYDEIFRNLDVYVKYLFGFIINFFDWIQTKFDFGAIYVRQYQMLYLITFIIIYWKKPKYFRIMFFSVILTLLIGTIIYCFLPAIGPFYYSSSPSSFVQQEQNAMLMKYNLYRISNGEFYTFSLVIQGIAAMPSLHVAETFIFLYFIYKYSKKWLFLYIPCFLYFFTEAMYVKYHYSVDVIAGIILAIACIYLSSKIYQKRDKLLNKLNKLDKLSIMD